MAIKQSIKKIFPWVPKLYTKWEASFASHLTVISPMLSTKMQYKQRFKRKLNLKDPKTLNEKLIWLKLNRYADDSTVVTCADKYAVRFYLEENGYGEYVNELIGVWDRVEDIDFDALPDRFAMKVNHGCGYNIICTDKSKFDVDKAKTTLNTWLKEDYWKKHAELHYRHIQPKIICEKFISGENGKLPVDYKFYCFNGEPLYIGNFIERDLAAHTIIRGYFDTDWNPLDICKTTPKDGNFTKPSRLADMVELARQMSKPFPFVRVDFYECDGKIIFGEFTFTPTGCMGTYYTDEAEKKYGELLRID